MEKSIRDYLPGINDGFDTVFTLDEEQNLVRAEMSSGDKTLKREFEKFR